MLQFLIELLIIFKKSKEPGIQIFDLPSIPDQARCARKSVPSQGHHPVEIYALFRCYIEKDDFLMCSILLS